MKKILILILAFMLCFACVSCNSNDKNDENDNAPKKTFEEFECKVSYGNYLDDTDLDELYKKSLNRPDLYDTAGREPIFKIDTKQELTQFLIDYDEYIPYHDYDYEETFIAATKPYDEEFFEENSLFVVFFITSSSPEYGLKNVDISGNRACVYIERTDNSTTATDDLVGRFVTVTVKKSTIKDCTSFDAVLIVYKQAE